MRRGAKAVAIGGIAVAVLGAGVGFAAASGADLAGGTQSGTAETGTDTPITGDALGRAESAALAHTGGGQVVETEVENEVEAGRADEPYEVEVAGPDGTQTEVELDADFSVVTSEVDDDSDDAGDGAGDDSDDAFDD